MIVTASAEGAADVVFPAVEVEANGTAVIPLTGLAADTFYSVGYPSKAFHAVNGYALRRMVRFLNHKSQRRYRLKFADTYYGELNHYGMYWLKWADVRGRRN